MRSDQVAIAEGAGKLHGEGPFGLGPRRALSALALGWVCLVALAVLGVAAVPALGAIGTIALGAGLAAAGLAAGALSLSRRRVRERLAGADAELASLKASLREAADEAAALRSRLGEAKHLATVGTMSAQIAHQLRNPLTSIQLYVQLLEDDLRKADGPSAAEAFDLLDLVLNELRSLVEITDNYLQYARLPALEAAPLDLNPAVGELVRFLRPEFARNGITVSARLQDGLAPVAGDRRLLRLALMNLLKNAAEAMGPGGRLRVKTCQQNGAVEIHVADTGPGIAAADLERIFEPFYTTKDSGSGLGLSLSRQIVEKHDGSLACQSMVGVGTTFVVKLPVHAAHVVSGL